MALGFGFSGGVFSGENASPLFMQYLKMQEKEKKHKVSTMYAMFGDEAIFCYMHSVDLITPNYK